MPATNKKMELITKVKMGGCSRWGEGTKNGGVEAREQEKRKQCEG